MTRTATKKFTGRRQGIGEGVLEYAQRQLKERPPAENGTDPVSLGRGRAPILRSSRKYFRGSRRFPHGLEIGGSQIYTTNPDSSLNKPDFRPDLCAAQLDELEAIANDREYVTQGTKDEIRRLKQKRLREIDTYGRPVETASEPEQWARAMGQVGPEVAEKLKRVMSLSDDKLAALLKDDG